MPAVEGDAGLCLIISYICRFVLRSSLGLVTTAMRFKIGAPLPFYAWSRGEVKIKEVGLQSIQLLLSRKTA